VLALYLALTVAVVVGSPLDALDRSVRVMPLDRQAPGWHHFVLDYVMLGQRGPSTAVAIVWIAWLCHSRRTLDPLIRFGTALLLLNLSVGVAKIATGRWGPHVTAHARDVLAGGDIYPSGHTSNAVVLFGVLAVLATRHRATMIALAVWVSLTVGLSTLYLDTHWVTDVVGGWLAGGLVLMVLPRTAHAIENRLERADTVFNGRLRHVRFVPPRTQVPTDQEMFAD
jgi:membrane-associated phospholipid phosphatase